MDAALPSPGVSGLELVIEPATVATAIVHLRGELDAVSVGRLAACVAELEPGFTTVVLDLRELTFLDSMGIGLFVKLHNELDRSARLLQFRNVGGHPRRVLELTDVHHLLNLL